MSLVRVLEIDRALVAAEDQMGLNFAERLWQEEGRPSDAARLGAALENILSACTREGLRYPAILLRRKKELQCGSWTPRFVDGLGPAARAPAEVGICKFCGGTGSITNPGGLSARFCECFLRKVQAQHDAKRGTAAF